MRYEPSTYEFVGWYFAIQHPSVDSIVVAVDELGKLCRCVIFIVGCHTPIITSFYYLSTLFTVIFKELIKKDILADLHLTNRILYVIYIM